MRHQLIPFPVKEHNLALYLQHVAEATKSKAAVEEAVYSRMILLVVMNTVACTGSRTPQVVVSTV